MKYQCSARVADGVAAGATPAAYLLEGAVFDGQVPRQISFGLHDWHTLWGIALAVDKVCLDVRAVALA